MVLIKGGQVVDPKRQEAFLADVVLGDGKIVGIGVYEDDGTYETVMDARGCVVAPGLIDVHVHFRDPGLTYKEDIQTGALGCRGWRIYYRGLHGEYKTSGGSSGNFAVCVRGREKNRDSCAFLRRYICGYEGKRAYRYGTAEGSRGSRVYR